ncbi:uncharacterized protein LOC113855964 [Abrus precatorius]|uniref:Uncharacterized protein LOC113855964 n=1 Tax=Abrus precatorius TaxID=3816 RepID=A0A8B8KKM4_ABRPR|nr:uncharacterized protein LOC113855964 [Abrus precatorius]
MKLSFNINMPSLWRECLSSAFRMALGCTIVGCVTLYGPLSIRTFIAFPAFSYVTVILIMQNNATLGDTLLGCWLALYATIQSIGPSMLSLWVIGPNRFSKGTVALAVALASFVVVLPSAASTHLVAKRISLGQIVLVYVTAYVNGVHTDPLMHPIRLAASTALGMMACVLALLLPYPRLACYEVNQWDKQLTNNILKRLKVLVKVLCEEDKTCALRSISQVKSLVTTRTKLLSIIMRYQDGMQWERFPTKIFRSHSLSPIERLQEVDMTVRGMELALTCTNPFPINIPNEDLRHGLNSLEEHISLTIKHAKLGGSPTVPESNAKSITHILQSLHTIPTTHQELPIFFFLFCAKLLHKKSLTEPPTCIQDMQIKKKENIPKGKEKWANWDTTLRSTNLIPAIKLSLSLGLAVFMGSLYNNKNGFWAGLPVAVSYVSGREATFRATNVKAHGSVLGTVYGVLGCFVFERFLSIRFLSLLPWFIFTSFLQRSRMYGPAGGISAAIGAILVLGRKNFGPPSEFAITRIIETFVGLSCSIFMDLIFVPRRTSTWAKMKLSQCLATLSESIESLSLFVGKTDLENCQKRFKMQVNELGKFVAEAKVEPNFWFLPFHNVCYDNLLGSLSRLVDLICFGEHALKFLQQEFQRGVACGKEDVNMLQSELGHVKEIICSSIKSLEEISRMKSLMHVEKELEKRNISSDIEDGKSPECDTCMVSGLGEDGIGEIIGSYLQRSRSIVDNLYGDEDDKELKSQVVLCLSALGFCLSACIKGTIEIEEAIQELVQWENPSSQINLCEISCKLRAFNK